MKLLTFLFLLFFLKSNIAFGDVIIEGAEGKSTKLIREFISKNINDPSNLNELEKTMAAIYNTGLYNDVEVYFEDRGGKSDVIFKLYPIRVVKTIKFQGNTSFSYSDLFTELGVTEGEGYAAEKIKSGVESIKRFYNLNGFLNASVAGSFANTPGTSELNLTIEIQEGPPCLIDGVIFRSVNNDLNRDLEKHFKRDQGKIFSQNLLTSLQNEINSYLFDDRYLSATVSAPESVYDPLKTKVTVAYVINDPYAFSLLFEGNQNFDETKIRKELDLNPENRLSTSPLEDLTERILRFYKKQGYASATVKYKENLFTQDYLRRVTFIIDEGPKVHIKEISFEGNFSKSQKYYKDFLLEHGGDLVGGNVYNSDDIDGAAKNLVIDLQNQGFISAKITGMRTDFDKRHENAIIHITLDEGPQTFVDKIVFQGVHSISIADLENTIGLKAKAPLDLAAVESSSTKIMTLYQSKGYLNAQVTNQGKSIIGYAADNTKATLTYDVVEGPLITVSAIVIEGNSFTKEYVIRRELQFHPGEVLTPEKLAYTEERLQRLGFFTAVDIHTLEEDPTQGNRTVLVKVTERPPGVFKGGLGVNNDLGLTFRGFTGFGYRNLFGTGRGIDARVEVDDKVNYNFYQSNFNLGYTEPFIFDTNNTARVNLIRSRNLWTYDSVNNFTWALDTAQGDISIERDITQKLKLVYKLYSIAQLTQFEIYNNTSSSTIDIGTTGPTLLYDRRDDPFNPTRGDISSISVDFANPVLGSTSTVDYLKAVASYTRYTPMGKVVWANQVQGGYARNLSGLTDGAIPAFEGFILGGRSTLRAFDPIKETIPLPTDFAQQNGTIYVVPNNSDTYFMLTKSEVRFPIIGNLGGAVFYDGGKVGMAGFNPTFTWRDDVGIGLRYNTPVGPVSIDYAYKLERDMTRIGATPTTPGGPESVGQLLFSFGVF